MTSVQSGLATRTSVRLPADPSRVVIRLFVPGQEGFELQDSRAGTVLRRILALDDEDVTSALNDVVARFEDRHRDLSGTFRRHARELADRLNPADELTESRSLLLGAAFTSEYATEGAALCNPSMAAHPDQSGIDSGSVRFVMSVRGIGEGHLSSIGFRTGRVDASGTVSMDDMTAFACVGATDAAVLSVAVFRSELARLDDAGEAADFVFDSLGSHFTPETLDSRLGRLETSLRTQAMARRRLRSSAASPTGRTRLASPQRFRWPSGCCGRQPRPRAPGWRTDR